MSAGVGSSRKGEFALALAARLADQRRVDAVNVAVPAHITEIFEFLHSAKDISGDEPPAEASSDESASEVDPE
jgi:hypothetical protein